MANRRIREQLVDPDSDEAEQYTSELAQSGTQESDRDGLVAGEQVPEVWGNMLKAWEDKARSTLPTFILPYLGRPEDGLFSPRPPARNGGHGYAGDLPDVADVASCRHCQRCHLEWRVPDPTDGRCTTCGEFVTSGRLPEADAMDKQGSIDSPLHQDNVAAAFNAPNFLPLGVVGAAGPHAWAAASGHCRAFSGDLPAPSPTERDDFEPLQLKTSPRSTDASAPERQAVSASLCQVQAPRGESPPATSTAAALESETDSRSPSMLPVSHFSPELRPGAERAEAEDAVTSAGSSPSHLRLGASPPTSQPLPQLPDHSGGAAAPDTPRHLATPASGARESTTSSPSPAPAAVPGTSEPSSAAPAAPLTDFAEMLASTTRSAPLRLADRLAEQLQEYCMEEARMGLSSCTWDIPLPGRRPFINLLAREFACRVETLGFERLEWWNGREWREAHGRFNILHDTVYDKYHMRLKVEWLDKPPQEEEKVPMRDFQQDSERQFLGSLGFERQPSESSSMLQQIEQTMEWQRQLLERALANQVQFDASQADRGLLQEAALCDSELDLRELCGA